MVLGIILCRAATLCDKMRWGGGLFLEAVMHLASSLLRWIIFGLIVLSAVEVAAAGDAKVYRFTSARRLAVDGRDHLVIIADSPAGGHPTRLVVPHSDANKYSPPPEIADAVKGFAAGQFVSAQTHLDGKVITVETINGWNPRPGEDSPHGYILLQGGPGDGSITLSKYGESLQIKTPVTKDAQGNAATDPAIDAELRKIQGGDVVWVDFSAGASPVLQAIVPWSDPQTGKLMRVALGDVDGQRGYVVEINTDQKPVTALIPLRLINGKWISDPRIVAAANKPARGSDVLFRTREDGDKTWLLDIEPPPKAPAPVAQRQNNPPPAGIPVRVPGGAGQVPGVGGIPGGF